HEAQRQNAAVMTPDCDFAHRTPMDDLRPAARGWRRNGLGLAHELLDAVGLDQRVDHESAAGLPLAIAAVAAVDEHRLRREPVAHPAAGAAALQGRVQLLLHRSLPNPTGQLLSSQSALTLRRG